MEKDPKYPEDHFYELESVSGVLTCCLDGKENISLHFTSAIKISIVFDSVTNSLVGKRRKEKESSDLKKDASKRKTPKLSPESGFDRRDTRSFESSIQRRTSPRVKMKVALFNAASSPVLKLEKTQGKSLSSQSGISPDAGERKMIHTAIDEAGWEKKTDQNKTVHRDLCRAEPDGQKKVHGKETSESCVENCAESKSVSDSVSAGKAVKCKYCEKSFQTQKEFFDHRKAPESVHTCKICGKTEPFKAHLIVHMLRHTSVDKKQDDHHQNVKLTSENVLGESKVKVDTNASHKTDTSSSLKEGGNLKKKGAIKCNICDSTVSSLDSLKIHTMLHTGECPYLCCVCGKTFSSLTTRQYHIESHFMSGKFKCLPCGQQFMSRADLAKHKQSHEIKCVLCGELFPNKTSRSCHYRVAHATEVIKCNLCHNMFPTQAELDKHMLYRRKGKREQCPVCGVVVSKLKDHMQLHNPVSEDKLYACSQCPMKYLRMSNLKRHMMIHTGEKPYACDRCPRRFRSNGMLRKHLLTHTQEKPYQCEVCGKRCALKSNLSTHMRIHNSDKLYSCPFCLQSFNHKNSLSNHMRSKHSQTKAPTSDSNSQFQQPLNTVSNLRPRPGPELAQPNPTDEQNRHLQEDNVHSSVFLTQHYSSPLPSSSKAPPAPFPSPNPYSSLSYLVEPSRGAEPSPYLPGGSMEKAGRCDEPSPYLVEKAVVDPAMTAASYLHSLVTNHHQDHQVQHKDQVDLHSGPPAMSGLQSSMLIEADRLFMGKYGVDSSQSGHQGF